MKIVHISEAEKILWDSYISTHASGHFMHSYAWGAIREMQGWKVNRLMVIEGERPLAAMMLQSKKIPVLGKYIAYCPRGPVFEADRQDALKFLLQKAWECNNNGMLRMDPYYLASDERCVLLKQQGCEVLDQKWSHWNNPRYVMFLDLSQGKEALYKNIASKNRNELKQPEKKGVVFRMGDETDLNTFHSLMRETAELKKIAVHDSAYYKSLYGVLQQEGMVGLFFGDYEGVSISTGMSIKYGDKAWLIYAASAKGYYQLKANRALQMKMIEWALDAGCTRYDLRGSATNYPPQKTDKGYGVYEFKKSFGSELVVLSPYMNYTPNTMARLLPKLIDWVVMPLMYKVSFLRNTRKRQ